MKKLPGDVLHRHLGRRGGVEVGLVRHHDDGVVAEDKVAGRHHQPLDRVAVVVGVLVHRDRRSRRPRLGDKLVAGIGPRPNLNRGDRGGGDVVFELAADQ
jgi:hypothetical protein